jgi:hypothetical protein
MDLVATPFFLRKAAGPLTDSEREQLIAFVGTNSEAGAVMPEIRQATGSPVLHRPVGGGLRIQPRRRHMVVASNFCT